MITVINRSEVVGRPLGALLANDGARVLSADIDCKPSPLLPRPHQSLIETPYSHRRILKTPIISNRQHIPLQPTPRGLADLPHPPGMPQSLRRGDQRRPEQGLQS